VNDGLYMCANEQDLYRLYTTRRQSSLY